MNETNKGRDLVIAHALQSRPNVVLQFVTDKVPT